MPYILSRARNSPIAEAISGASKIVTCPEKLDFRDEPESTAAFLGLIRREAAKRNTTTVVVDFTHLVTITPAAALTIIAEMFRTNHLYPHVHLRVRRPVAPEPEALLTQVGFYDYSDAIKTDVHVDGSRSYWKHRRGSGVQQLAAKELIEFMSAGAVPYPSLLFEALVEGMQNTSEHAYDERQDYRSWWLLGYYEPDKREVAFCFYDQGDGIPATIRTRFKDRLPLFSNKGSELIEKAVVEGRYSKTKKKNRGSGLPTLKRFVDSAANGELLIFSRESRCVFCTSQPTVLNDYDTWLRGTLISWTLQTT